MLYLIKIIFKCSIKPSHIVDGPITLDRFDHFHVFFEHCSKSSSKINKARKHILSDVVEHVRGAIVFRQFHCTVEEHE